MRNPVACPGCTWASAGEAADARQAPTTQWIARDSHQPPSTISTIRWIVQNAPSEPTT